MDFQLFCENPEKCLFNSVVCNKFGNLGSELIIQWKPGKQFKKLNFQSKKQKDTTHQASDFELKENNALNFDFN